MDLSARLAQERRARLAAERLLELKQAELFDANRKLGRHALKLSHEITETRAEVRTVRDENQRVKSQLGAANEKIEVVESQLWKALEAVNDGFAMFSAGRVLELANPSYLAMFDGLDTIRPGASYAHVIEMMLEEGIVDLQGECPHSWRDRMLTRWDAPIIPTETVRLWDGRFVKLRDRRTPDGGFVTMAVDITDLMRMWSAVEELPDGFVIYDAEDRLLMCNDPYRDLYRASAPAMQPGTTFEDILRYGLQHGQYEEAVGREEEWLEERLEAHRRASNELEQQLDDGRWVRVFERETRDGGRVGLRIDITHMKETQRDLEEARRRAEAANRAKSAFLANMSHEIRTPMNGVVGMADLLMESDLGDEQQLYVETIRSSGEALLVIINDILDYSKIEAEKLVLHPEPFDLERAIHEVVMLLQPTARDKGIALLVDFDMFLPTRFIGDPGRLRQALTNLVGNAVKFTTEGHVLVRVIGVPSADGQTAVHVTVEDTGIGIPPDKIDHVFGEFNQVEDDRNREFEGTGLGLAITRRLIEMMEGEVWVESELGVGTCFGFRVVLPVAEPATYETVRVPAHLKRVLVVDDNNTNRSVLCKQLSAVGLDIDYCATGGEALDRIVNRPDVLIVEQDLPDMEGAELARRVAMAQPGLPVLLLASNHGQSALQGSPGAVCTVLQKPAPRRALFAALEALEDCGAQDADAVASLPAGGAASAMDAATVDAPARAAKAAPEQAARSEPKGLPQPDAVDRDGPEPATAEPSVAGSVSPDPENPRSPDTAEDARPIDVLVAEDNRTNQLVFRKMAGGLGLDLSLRFANNGLEAVEAFRAQRPDLVFMDISMPKMDGKEATREIRALEGAGPRVPIIAVTAHAMTGDREGILEAGLDDYLTKPLRKADLAAKFDAHLPAALAAAREPDTV